MTLVLPLPSLLLLPAEAHVEVALAAGSHAFDEELGALTAGPSFDRAAPRVRAVRTFVREAVAALVADLAPASPIAVTLATHAAVKEVTKERLLPGSGEMPTEATSVALGATIDRAIGALRRSGPLRANAAKRSLSLWAAAVQERVDVRLRSAGWFDARGAGSLLARYIAGATDEVLAELGALGGAELRGVLPWDTDDLAWIEALHRRSRAAGGAGVVLRMPRFEGDEWQGPLANAEAPLGAALERRWADALEHPELEWTEPAPAKVLAVRSSRTAAAEARAVAASVLEALAAGIAPERVAVVVPRTTQDAAEPICAALTEARVAFAEPRGRSILACPDGRAALALLALAEGPFTRDGLLEVLRAPGLHAGLWVEASDEVEAAMRVARLASRLRDVPVDVDGSGSQFEAAIATLVAEDPDDAWMPRAMERMVASVRWLAEGGTLSEGLRRFVTVLDRMKLGQPSARDLAAALADEKRGYGALGLSAMGENASAMRRLRELLAEIGEAAIALGMGGAPMSAAELRALLNGLAERTGARAGGTAARAGAVRIGRPEEIAGLPFERVIVTGLLESAYGDEDEEDDVLGGDAGADGREGRDGRDVPEGRTRARAPRRTLALATVLASARDVVLTYATGDEDDFEKPHALVSHAIEHEAARIAEPASRVAPRASILGKRSAELVALAGGRPPVADLAERVRIERARLAFFMDPKTLPDDFTGRVRLDDGMHAILPSLVGGSSERHPIAVTAIEKAAGCAFAGFARRVLRIKRIEDLAEAGDARERGTLVHRALSVVFDAARDTVRALERDGSGASATSDPARPANENALKTGQNRASKETLAEARTAVFVAARDAAERALELHRIVSPLRREAILSAVRDALAVLARAWDDDEPMQFFLGEQRFGASAPHPWGSLALEPHDDEGDAPLVFVDGQIDRIDATGDLRRVRIIDYKTGRVPEGDLKKTALQLPMYAAVAARALGATSIEAMYLRVTPRGMIDEYPKNPTARLVKPEELIERAREARRAVRALWEGRVAPRPIFLSLCATCDARDLCRRPAVMPIEELEERS